MTSSIQLRLLVQASLFAALTTVGAWVAVPIGPVPIVLQNLFIFLSGLVLGSRWAMASVAVYLLAGALGLPVFAGGMGGIGRLAGPTGGYLIGYLPAAGVIGWISARGKGRVPADVLALGCGMLLVYGPGVWWLKTLTGMSLPQALAAGAYPFLPGDLLKMAAAVPLARTLRPLVQLGPHQTTDGSALHGHH